MSTAAPDCTFPLPEGWSETTRFEDVIDADGLRLHRVGMSSSCDGMEAIGAAADAQESPASRAQFELLERVSVLQASRNQAPFPTRALDGRSTGARPAAHVFPTSSEPAVWAHARSNGVALYTSWTIACERAELELAERDRVLRSWLGETTPLRLALDTRASRLSVTSSYEWSAYVFPPPPSGGFAPSAQVVGLFGFPCRPTAPFVFGYGARSSVEGALEAATREAMQLLAFLWGEPVCDRVPEPAPTPMCHLETFQSRERQHLLKRWLEGAHRGYARPRAEQPTSRTPTSGATCFVNLTPPWLEGRLHVAKAISDTAVPLAFGLAPVTAHLPPELRIHPIP